MHIKRDHVQILGWLHMSVFLTRSACREIAIDLHILNDTDTRQRLPL